ncbi:MAG: type IV pilin protein [Bdellovibrio sp.]|jgi:type IV pilus assembly protein PilA
MMNKSNQRGFSLVELMVVVAIIGILATIAIPRVNKFIAKARQSEAQVNLSSLYTFNKNFFVEFQGYSSSFDALGFVPEGNLRYNIGWVSGTGACPTNFTTLKGAAACTTPSSTKAVCTGGRCTTLNGANNAAPTDIAAGTCPVNTPRTATLGTACVATDFSTFAAGARAQLVSGALEDSWIINQDKGLANNSDGTL